MVVIFPTVLILDDEHLVVILTQPLFSWWFEPEGSSWVNICDAFKY